MSHSLIIAYIPLARLRSKLVLTLIYFAWINAQYKINVDFKKLFFCWAGNTIFYFVNQISFCNFFRHVDDLSIFFSFWTMFKQQFIL